MSQAPRARYSDAEECANGITHGLGALLAAAGFAVLVVAAVQRGTAVHVVSSFVFGLSLLNLYASSTLYHTIRNPGAKRVLRRLDHAAIFLLIAGTYTPVCLVTLRGEWGWSVFAVVWGVAFGGTILKLCFRSLPRWISASIYLAMGWTAVVAAVPLVHALPVPALLWLLAGGLLYTAGAVIYATRRPNPFPRVFGFHEIFHLFVLGGSISHFVFMLRWVVPF